MTILPEKRKNRQIQKGDLFKEKSLNSRLKKEKRTEEIEKIIEVKSQEKTYYMTLFMCGFIILFFLIIAFINL